MPPWCGTVSHRLNGSCPLWQASPAVTGFTLGRIEGGQGFIPSALPEPQVKAMILSTMIMPKIV